MKNILLLSIVSLTFSATAFAGDAIKVDPVSSFKSILKASCGLIEPESYHMYNIETLDDMEKCKTAAKEMSEDPGMTAAIPQVLELVSQVGVELLIEQGKQAGYNVDLNAQLGNLTMMEFLKSLK